MHSDDLKRNRVLEQRVRACWRTRACMAGLCAGVQVFLLGAGAAVPLSLNAAWLAALFGAPVCALAAYAARRRMSAGLTRARALVLALTLDFGAVFAVASLVSLAEQSLLAQARTVWSMLAAFSGAAACALLGRVGLARLCFLLRLVLPVCAGALCAASLGFSRAAGPWPLLGSGADRLMLSCLCMASSAVPSLLLLLPPPEIDAADDEARRCPVPGAGFFAWRLALGAACGALLVFAVCVCSGYESLAAQQTWGGRLRILCSAQPREGVVQTLLTGLQVIAITLLAGCLLSGAEQALTAAWPGLGKWRGGLALSSLWALLALLGLVFFGMEAALVCAPLTSLPAAALLLGRRAKERTA